MSTEYLKIVAFTLSILVCNFIIVLLVQYFVKEDANEELEHYKQMQESKDKI